MEKVYNISVSLNKYSDKNCIKWQTMQYAKRHLTIDELIELIKEGYCFCHCFTTQSDIFGLRDKTDCNFKEANMVFIDIDDSVISMNDFITKLSYKPTLAYTTPNNHTEKSNYQYRFRLCYIFDSPITRIDIYKRLYQGIISATSKDIEGFVCKDNCGRSPSQQFSGNGNGNCETFISRRIYNLNDFELLCKASVKQVNETQPCSEAAIPNSQFLIDFRAMKSYDFIMKYRHTYTFFESTPLEYHNGYAILPKNYTMIRRAWYWDNFIKKDGTVKYFGKHKKLRDGDKRKKKLYASALIRKQILPTITFEHLLFNLVSDREYYYDNTDNELNNNRLIDMCKRVIATPIEDIDLPLYRPKEFEVDKAYCIELGITPNQMKNIVRRKLKDMEIGGLYDCSKSLAENLTMLKDMGIKVGKSRLYVWCRDNGINTSPKGDNNTTHDKVCLTSSHSVRLYCKHKIYSFSAA